MVIGCEATCRSGLRELTCVQRQAPAALSREGRVGVGSPLSLTVSCVISSVHLL